MAGPAGGGVYAEKALLIENSSVLSNTSGSNGGMSAEETLKKRLAVDREISFSDQIDPRIGNV